jgi:hypothetical protein
MDIQTTLDNYKSLGDYFAPDYDQENEVLNSFRKENPTLSKQQTTQLIDILNRSNDISDKYFVADLLYLYDEFDQELLEPLLLTAINYKDPSFNRIFLRPCITAFGSKTVADSLADKFRKADILERIGIANLLYWLRPQENGEADNLHQTILEKANRTENLIELYYYKLRYADKIKDSAKIPNSAEELMKAIKGNNQYESLLFDKLNWTRNNGC